MDIQDKRVVVTGGAGFIGSHVVDALVAKGNRVVIVDNFSTGKDENIQQHRNNPRVDTVRADVRDLERMTNVTRDANIIFHLAVACLRISLYDPQSVHEVNATGSLNICRAALENHVQRLVYISSSESYGTANHVPMAEDHPLNPTTVYGASKLAGEAYTRAFWHTYKLPTMVVRPFNTYGPREHCEGASAEVIPRFVLRIMNQQSPVIFGDGKQTRDFTWVLDTAKGIVMAAECDELVGDNVNIARGEEVSLLQLVDIIQIALGKPKIEPVFMPEGRPGDVYRHFADIGKARRLLSFEPSVGIREGIAKYIAWIRDQGEDVQRSTLNEKLINWQG